MQRTLIALTLAVATLTALAHLVATPAPSESVYNARGLLIV